MSHFGIHNGASNKNASLPDGTVVKKSDAGALRCNTCRCDRHVWGLIECHTLVSDGLRATSSSSLFARPLVHLRKRCHLRTSVQRGFVMSKTCTPLSAPLRAAPLRLASTARPRFCTPKHS